MLTSTTSPTTTVTRNGKTHLLGARMSSAIATTAMTPIVTCVLARSVTSCSSWVDQRVAWSAPHWPMLASSATSRAFERMRYARAPSTSPPTTASARARVRARPVAVPGSSRPRRSRRSQGCRTASLPSCRAAAALAGGGAPAAVGYRSAARKMASPKASEKARRIRKGMEFSGGGLPIVSDG